MSRTEQAIQALFAAIGVQLALVVTPTMPVPLRNQALPTRLFEAGSGLQIYINVWDGDGDVTDETLGADDPGQTDGYNIEHRCAVELVVAAGADADREAAFDVALLAIYSAVKRDAGTGLYLGGVVDQSAIEKIQRSGGKGLITDGLPNIKAAHITVLLTFTSSRPF